MAFSGTTDFSMTAQKIIESSLRKCGLLAEGEAASEGQIQDALDDLNMLMKTLQSDGLSMFTVKDVFLFPQLSRNKYFLPDNNQETNYDENIVVEEIYRSTTTATTPAFFISGTATAGSNTITAVPEKYFVDIGIGLTIGSGLFPIGSTISAIDDEAFTITLQTGEIATADELGTIVQIIPYTHSNTIFSLNPAFNVGPNVTTNYKMGFMNPDTLELGWRSVASVGTDIAGNFQVTLVTPFNGTPIDNDIIFFYDTAKVVTGRPLRVLESYAILNSDGANVPMGIISRQEYDSLATKTAAGDPNQLYFDPQLNSSELNIWPQVSRENLYIQLVCKFPVDDIISQSDTLFFSQEWYLPVMLGLAQLIALDCGLPSNDFRKISMLYEAYYDMVAGFDRENETSIFFAPNTDGRG